MYFLFNIEQFSKEYSKVSHLSKESETLNKQTKPKLVESLKIALTTLQLANSCMKKQSDTILNSMDELMKQTDLTRTFIENKKTDSPNESSSKNISYA